jgi:autotransporter adhesin
VPTGGAGGTTLSNLQLGIGASAGTNGVALGVGASAGTNGTSVGFGSSAGAFSFAGGSNAYAAGPYDTAVGAGAHVGADHGTAVGAGTSIDPAATYATAIGYGASVGPHGQNAVAIGANSVADAPNTVSFGSPGNERRLTNVAAGVNNTDAANFGQVRRAYGGVAMAFAMTAASPALAPGEQSVSGGVGYYKSESGWSLRYEARPTNQVFVSAGVAINNDGDVGGSAGIGFKW